MTVTSAGRQTPERVYLHKNNHFDLLETENVGQEYVEVYGELFCQQKGGLDRLRQGDKCLFIRKQSYP